MNLLHARSLTVLTETPTIYEGSNGTNLGRCADRDKLGWPLGTWDSEPDVIAWHYKNMMPMLGRAADGRWCAYLFGESSAGTTLKWLEAEANIPTGALRIFGGDELVSLGGLNYWGMAKFADEVISRASWDLIIEPSGLAPINAGRSTYARSRDEGYVDAAAKLAQLARLIKAIDPSQGQASEPVSVETIDARMSSELALLDKVLR